jgi:hypothetical protein
MRPTAERAGLIFTYQSETGDFEKTFVHGAIGCGPCEAVVERQQLQTHVKKVKIGLKNP